MSSTLSSFGFPISNIEFFLRGDFFDGAARVIIRMFRLDKVLDTSSKDLDFFKLKLFEVSFVQLKLHLLPVIVHHLAEQQLRIRF